MSSFKSENQHNNQSPYELTVLAEQTSQIYASSINGIITNIINATILIVVLWSVIPHETLLIWLASILFVSIVRGLNVYRYNKASPSSDETHTWTRQFLVGVIFTSIVWGASSIFLFPTEDLARQVFLAFVVGGMAAGAITSLSYIKTAIYIYLFFTLIPLAVRFFISGTELSLAMGSMITLASIVFLQSAKQSYAKSKQNFSMRIDNIEQQRSLEQSEHRYETLLATATDAFFLHDLKGNFIDVNNQACLSLGYTRDELLSMSVENIEHSTANEDIHNIWGKLKESENLRLEGVHQRKDGTTFPVEVSIGSIHIGNEFFLSVLARDVTERKRIDKMKNDFISTVSHELRTPLTSIRGALGLITGGAVGEVPSQIQEMLSVAENNTDRLLFLINDILDIQKIESGEFEMEMNEMELTPFIKQAIKDNSSYADQYDVKILFSDTFNGNIKICANKERLMQVMANLLSNAAKFSYANGNIEVSISENKDNTVRVSIIDHGEGIAEEFQPRMFDKFTQQDSSDTKNKGGTGLGLNISKAIIEKHEGKFGFTSTLDKGSTFYFDLPKL